MVATPDMIDGLATQPDASSTAGSAPNGMEQGAKGLNNASHADFADAAHGLEKKQAKLAEEAHRQRHSKISDQPAGLSTALGDDSNQTALSKAMEAGSDKMLNGGLMFAGFSILLTGMMLAVPALMPFLPGVAATVISAAATGAVWLGGNEFYKVYKEERAKEESALNRTIERGKELFGHAKDRVQHFGEQVENTTEQRIGELGTLAGGIQSHLAGVGTLAHQPELAAAPRNQTVDEILARGPRRHVEALQARDVGSKPQSYVERVQHSAADSEYSRV